MSGLYEWIDAYCQALPPAIRPTSGDSRFNTAAMRARGNGWTPTHAARVVMTVNYSNAHNPPYIALLNLERVAERAPHQKQQTTADGACHVCAPSHCPDPMTPADVIPSDWAEQRMQLYRELSRIPLTDMSEDERAHAMQVLIDHQRKALPWSTSG